MNQLSIGRDEASQARLSLVVALGAGISPEGRPTEETIARAKLGAALVLGAYGSELITCGKGPDRRINYTYSEAELMANAAIEQGVDPGMIVAETGSTDTFESLCNIRPYVLENNVGWLTFVSSLDQVRRVARMTRGLFGRQVKIAFASTEQISLRRPAGLAVGLLNTAFDLALYSGVQDGNVAEATAAHALGVMAKRYPKRVVRKLLPDTKYYG